MLVCTVIAAAGMANAAGARAIQTPRNNARMRLAVNDIMVKNYTRETRMKTLNLRHNANRAMSCIGGNSGIPPGQLICSIFMRTKFYSTPSTMVMEPVLAPVRIFAAF